VHAIWFSTNESFVKNFKSFHCLQMVCKIVNYFGINGLIKSIILVLDREYVGFLSYGPGVDMYLSERK